MKNYLKTILHIYIGAILLASCGSAGNSIKTARAAVTRGEYELAAENFKKAYKRIPPKEKKLRGEIAYEMAQTYACYGNVARAVTALKNAERYKFNDTLVFQQLGMLSMQMGNYKEAANYLEKHFLLTDDSLSKIRYYWAERCAGKPSSPTSATGFFKPHRSSPPPPIWIITGSTCWVSDSRSPTSGTASPTAPG